VGAGTEIGTRWPPATSTGKVLLAALLDNGGIGDSRRQPTRRQLGRSPQGRSPIRRGFSGASGQRVRLGRGDRELETGYVAVNHKSGP
jgi:hypothetical protein